MTGFSFSRPISGDTRKAFGTASLESAGWEGGLLLPGTTSTSVLYRITDHLGSIRAVRDAAGKVRQRFDYYPFGSVSRFWNDTPVAVIDTNVVSIDPIIDPVVPGNGLNGGLIPEIGDSRPVSIEETPQSALRYRFGGKEIAGPKVGASSWLSAPAGTPAAAAGRPYLDFGARLYDPRTATWLAPDPLSEKYYPVSPYAYCSNDPLNRFDPDGRADFKKIGWGLFNAGAGLTTAIGGGFVAVGSSGTAGLLGGAMI